ncbi:hypothetical protein [Phytomonospora endophytica]|uniref:Novel toxin 16 domain-containing protein n=1 Tax=Phytomonospora endophytica TaxID=714109 RepID=A0A841FUC5_9ACTN|nr:hypothetical protein [Phytomonospora endophytica]MBB6036129.1 hypothetical protein [Phytomonospora endophytica]GIG67032.1 hypothetical protein Pen01_33270 [Phytomonospora endophytica]
MHTRVPAEQLSPDTATPTRARPGPGVLALQRSAGNAAVAAHLAQSRTRAPHRPPALRFTAPANVQRCGPVACDCSNEERADYNAKHPEWAGKDVQRMVALQRWPGDGMVPPGDCDLLQYAALRLSVESAKAVTSMMGACAPGDSCLFLATKIAAITAEIGARVALDTTCFKGGDTGHRQQVQDKINMMNRCYRFFQNSNCSQGLIAAMEVVVASARAVIEAAAIAAVIAAIVALAVAIAALIEVIAAAVAAAAAAAAEAAAVMAGLAALAVLVGVLRDAASSATPSGA